VSGNDKIILENVSGMINRKIHPITGEFCEQGLHVVLRAQPALHEAVIFAILSAILLLQPVSQPQLTIRTPLLKSSRHPDPHWAGRLAKIPS